MNFKENKAIYLQISDYVFERILLNQWPAEEKIPSVRELAAKLEVNPNTVARTYERLQTMEIVYNRRGIGIFVASDARDKIKALRRTEFLQGELPEVFRSMYLLNIDLATFETLYKAFVDKTFNHENK